MSKYKEGDAVWYNGNVYPALQCYILTIDSVSSFADWTGTVYYTYEINFRGKSYTVGESYLADTYQPVSTFVNIATGTFSVNGGPAQTVSSGEALNLWNEIPSTSKFDIKPECSHSWTRYQGLGMFEPFDFCIKCDVKK